MASQAHQPTQPTAEEQRHLAVMDRLTNVLHHITEITRVLHEHAPRLPDEESTVIGSGNPVRVNRMGYHYFRIFAAAGGTVSANTSVGIVSLSLVAGWNNVDLPNETTLTSATPINVILQRTDYVPVA